MLKNVVTGLIIAQLIIVPLAQAQRPAADALRPTLFYQNVASSVAPIRDAVRETIENRIDIRSDARDNVRDGVQIRNQDLRTTMEASRKKLRTAAELRDREQFQDALTDRRTALQDRQKAFRDEVTAQREEMRARLTDERDAFRARLQNIKDNRRRQLVERIADRIQDLLARRVEFFTQLLNKLDEVLDRIILRRDKAASAGHNISFVDEAIRSATQAIDMARTAVADLADNSYPIGVTTDEALRADVEATRRLFATDLKRVFEAVQTARDAVRQAAIALGQIPRVDELDEPPEHAEDIGVEEEQDPTE